MSISRLISYPRNTRSILQQGGIISGLIAILVTLPASPAVANSASSALIGISRESSMTPRFSIWSGSAWGTSAAAINVGEIQSHIVTRNCPTRDETALATLDYQNDINVQFYKDGAWTGLVEVCTNTGTASERCFDVAYESLSGKMLIAFWNDSTSRLVYRTYDGTTLSAATSLEMPDSAAGKWVRLVSRPGANEITALVLNGSKHLFATTWNGTSFGSVATIHTNLNTSGEQCFDAAYESLSGKLVVAYAISSSIFPRYRIYDGSAWTSEANLPAIGGVGRWLRLEPDPASNQMLFGAIENNNDLNVNVWNGSAWGTNQELENEACWTQLRAFDIAYEPGGTRALIAYPDNWDNRFRYRIWDGSSWSTQTWGHNLADTPCLFQLRTGSAAGEIFLAVHTNNGKLHACRWSGSAFSAAQVIEDDMSNAWGKECFMIAAPTGPSVVPANVPYATDFESGPGAEWSDGKNDTNGTFTRFVGPWRTETLQLALNTTVGETYNLVFDFYAIDSWDGSTASDGSAPDYFIITADGTTIFNESFCHQWPDTQPQSYVFPNDQMGDYGYNASWKDGIYRKVAVSFVASSAVTTLAFSASLTDEDGEGYDDESWGIDNLSVMTARFRDVSAARQFNVQAASSWGSGMHWADLDNDGDLDCIVTGESSSRRLMNGLGGSNVFTSNTFGGGSVYRQGAMMDIDNDGDIDFWGIPGWENEKLYANDGSGALSDAGAIGFSSPHNNENTIAADVNGNGWIDIVHLSENGNWIGHSQGSESPALVGTTDASYGLNGAGSVGNGDYASSSDVNGDGRPDFFYHWNSGRLFLSNGDGAYTRNNYGISVVTGENDKFGSAWGDYDNDGKLDLFAARYDSGQTGYLWKNNVNWTASPPTGSFSNVTAAAGITDLAGRRSCAWGDYDNDGHLDLLVATRSGRMILYRNLGDGTFEHVDDGVGVVTGDFHDAVFVDYDNDGDLDIAATRLGGTVVLLENRTDSNGYLKVRVVGAGAGKTNKAGVGTRVELWNAAGTQLLARRDVGVARGCGIEPLWLHFGGTDPATTYQVKAYFNSGIVTKTVKPADVTTNIGGTVITRMLTIKEPSGVKVIQWSEVVNK